MNKKIVLSCWKETLDGGSIMRHYFVREVHNITGIYPEDHFNLKDSYDPIEYLWHNEIITDEEYGYDPEKDKDETKPYINKDCQIDVVIKIISQDSPQHVKLSWDSESSAIGLTTPRNESLELTYSGDGNYSAASTIAEAINNVSDSIEKKPNGKHE